MSDPLSVSIRNEGGKRRNRRLRISGTVPAVLYGHGQQTVSLAVGENDVSTALRQGVRVVELTGDVQDTALIRSTQWDSFGVELLHVDFQRVSATEKVETRVAIELRGIAPGINEGGTVDNLLHEIEILCPATSIPEKLEVNINDLHLGDSIPVSQLEIPEGAQLITNADAMVVQCIAKVDVDEEEGTEPADSAEPEVIGRKAEEEDDQ